MLENDKLQGFLLGTVITSIVYYLVHISYDTNGSTNQDNNKKKNLIRKIADDDCHSLFYGKNQIFILIYDELILIYLATMFLYYYDIKSYQIFI